MTGDGGRPPSWLGSLPPEPGQPFVCPFCGAALEEGQLHSCREMREDAPGLKGMGWERAPRLSDWGVIVIALAVLVYLGAYWLNSLGVGCTPR